MSKERNPIEIKTDSPQRVVAELFQHANRQDLFDRLDGQELTTVVFSGVVSLALKNGGTISGGADRLLPADKIGDLNALIGKRFHLKVTALIWQILADSVQLIVVIAVGGIDPGQISVLGSKVLSSLFANLERLDGREPSLREAQETRLVVVLLVLRDEDGR